MHLVPIGGSTGNVCKLVLCIHSLLQRLSLAGRIILSRNLFKFVPLPVAVNREVINLF